MGETGAVPGYWYADVAGRLVLVRALVFVDVALARVVVEYTNGRRLYLDPIAWTAMGLALHSPRRLPPERVGEH